MGIGFEFEEDKSRANKAKHGIDFYVAQALWEGVFLEIPSAYPYEDRWLVIGKIDETFRTAIITYRAQTVRIISVRHSRIEEIKLYEKRYHH